MSKVREIQELAEFADELASYLGRSPISNRQYKAMAQALREYASTLTVTEPFVPYEEQAKEIISNFDWSRVHKTMTDMKWTWFDSAAEDGVPTIGELVLKATRLLHDACRTNDEYSRTGTGGFMAYKEYGRLRLTFEVESWTGNYD